MQIVSYLVLEEGQTTLFMLPVIWLSVHPIVPEQVNYCQISILVNLKTFPLKIRSFLAAGKTAYHCATRQRPITKYHKNTSDQQLKVIRTPVTNNKML